MGEEVVVASTGYVKDYKQSESFTIKAYDAGTKTYTLNKKFKYQVHLAH